MTVDPCVRAPGDQGPAGTRLRTMPVMGRLRFIDPDEPKNAALPILASSLLAEGRSIYRNVPALGDVRTMGRLLERLGAGFDGQPNGVAFVDTVGVMLAGSKLPAAQIVCDMVREEGSAPQVAIVGQSLRASPQFAAKANAVAAHTMDYDFSYIQGQMVAPLVPAVSRAFFAPAGMALSMALSAALSSRPASGFAAAVKLVLSETRKTAESNADRLSARISSFLPASATERNGSTLVWSTKAFQRRM